MRPKHISAEGEFYFLTTHCAEGIRPFDIRSACLAFLEILKEKYREFKLRLFAYVVMPNHTHLLLQLPDNLEISKLMNHINGTSARKVNAALKNQYKHIWQGGFHDVMIRSAREFANKVNYIHDNPVRWNLVERAEDYEFSSAKFYFQKLGNPYLEMDGFDDFGLDGLLGSFYSVLD